MTNFNIEVQKCVEILNNGGIILYPTDTIYGIGSDSKLSDLIRCVRADEEHHSETNHNYADNL